MNYVAQPGGLNDRKQALIKALRSGRGGAGGAARLSGATPFGSIPRLGFRPDARSVFNRNENFNFSNSPQGQQDAFSAVSGPGMAQQGPPQQQQQMASLDGFGPSSPAPQGVPQNSISTQGAPDSGSTHLLERGPQAPPSQGVPGNVRAAFEGDGVMSGGVSAWLAANPWYLEQLMAGGGSGSPAGGGAVL